MKIGNVDLTMMQVGIAVLMLATAVIHLILGIGGGIIFILNGLGYLALWTAVYVPIAALADYRQLARWVLVAYTIVTIVLFFVFNAGSGYGAFGLITKAIEVVLVVLLFLDSRQ